MTTLLNRKILLIIAGGIAAYKALELIRLLRAEGASVQAILTKGGAEFITPLSVAALCEAPVYTDLWSLKDESEMGHIRLSRECDAILIAPASANLLAKMTAGLADDLASTVLLAADKPILVAPAMNVRMWEHAATQDNLVLLKKRNVTIIEPGVGAMACGETGPGRLADPADILRALKQKLGRQGLTGKKALVTSGPTIEPIDPVRFLGNYSTGKQGHALAAALAAAGAEVTLISGPVALTDPPGVRVVRVQTALEMLAACDAALPADIAVCAAAVADWRPLAMADQKIKKHPDDPPPPITLTENPDILRDLSERAHHRPRLVIGFAAETDDIIRHATEKRLKKGCDWILANPVGLGTETFGGPDNSIQLITAAGVETWPRMSKQAVADQLVDYIITFFNEDLLP
jgi:phosphopantothenoylcysteine decarboxylase/phosphopantothenate--cysteine ligase